MCAFGAVTVFGSRLTPRTCHRGHSLHREFAEISVKRLRRFALFAAATQAAEIAQLALLLSGSKKVFTDYSSEKTSNLTRPLDW